MDGYEPPPSPLKNFVGGGGCGCGCIGLLTVFFAGVIMALVPLEFFGEGLGRTIGMFSAAGLVCGAILALLGGVMWVASLFVE